MVKDFFSIKFAVLILFGIFICSSAVASTTDGTVSGYAWSENIGWINFGVTSGDIHVTDSAVTGNAWSTNKGWIKLDPTTSGVKNTTSGVLSGYAWGENIGWINFSGVTINSSGEFTGMANGTNTGRINFDCNYCNVTTDWRPQNQRATSGGGGLSPEAYNLPKDNLSVLINNGNDYTKDKIVILKFQAENDIKKIAISNFSDFKNAVQENYVSEKNWILSDGDGQKTVYVKFYTEYGQSSQIFSDSIILDTTTPPTILEKIKTGLEFLIPKILKQEEAKPVEIITVPKTAPVSLKNQWNLLPMNALSKFVLNPLPKDIAVLAEKFSDIKKIFDDVGIAKMTDLNKLKSVKLILPGLSEVVGLSGSEISSGKSAVPKGIPIVKLTSAAKNKIPTDIVFAKVADGLIDLNIALSLNDNGKIEQKISTIATKPLELVVRVDGLVKNVIGYVIFRSKNESQSSFEIPLNNLAASLNFANPSFAEIFNPNKKFVAVEGGPNIETNSVVKEDIEIETRLVIDKFYYQDTGDGVYTAVINAPVVDGEYEIITIINYLDESIESKEVKLITLVDPEGYIYEKSGDKETRIGGAVISIYWLNPETKQYELWAAKDYQQENPQTTDVRGSYSFLVPEGYYYLTVIAPGYLEYDGKPFEIKEGRGVHVNIELKNKYWWTTIIDWKTLLLIAITAMLLYNFYKDRLREKTHS